MSTSAVRQAARLRGIADHLVAFPDLAPVVVHTAALQIVPYLADSPPAVVMLEWAASIGADVVEVKDIKGTSFAHASGRLVGGGAEVTVWTVVEGFSEFLTVDLPASVPVSRLRVFADVSQVGGASCTR